MAAHEELTELARRRSELDGLEGPALLRALRAGVHRHLGLASFAEYVERLFGYSRRTLEDKLRTAEALEALPELTRSLREGAVSWSAVRELARVATPDTEREWLDAARGKPVHEVERLVSGQRRGARPADEPNAAEPRHTLRFDVNAETFATFREAMRALRQKSDGPLDDDSALLLMAREVLGGPADDGKSSYQVALNICERCRRATQDARGEAIAVDDAIVEMACCDAQHIGRVATSPTHVGANDVHETQAGAHNATDEAHMCTTDGRSKPRAGVNAGADESHMGTTDGRGEPRAGVNAVADGTHVGTNNSAAKTRSRVHGANGETHVGEPTRATRSIPPALRRKVMRRDHGRCTVPGCRNATFVDVHHIDPRTDGGAHEEDNLIVLCSAHHRALHRGQLHITDRVSQGLVFRRADGGRYGALHSATAVNACERAFRGLRGMGFSERDARRAVERVRSLGDTETMLRHALAFLTGRAFRPV